MYWTQDYGVFTATGWTGLDRDDGYCHLKQHRIAKAGSDFCSAWTNPQEDALVQKEPDAS